MNNQRRKHPEKYPPYHWYEWFEFFWLWIANPTFQHSPDKRKAYFEFRLGKHFESLFP